MTQPNIRVYTIGQSLIEVGRRSYRPDAAMVFATMLMLAVDRGRRIERETLAGMLWPNECARHARHNLRQVLYKLRAAGVEFEEANRPLSIARDQVWLDFEDESPDEIAQENGDIDSAEYLSVLPGFTPNFSREFTIWLDSVHDRAGSRVRARVVEAIARARRDGRWSQVERLARKCLHLDPLNEEANFALAEVIALSGAKSKAIALLDAYSTEVGPEGSDVRLPAALLRRRIADRLSVQRTTESIETTLVGRETIIGRVTGVLHASKLGKTHAHALCGASGIGKTRILEEGASVAGLLGGAVFMHSASADDKLTPGFSIVRLMNVLQDAPGTLGLDPNVRAALQRLTAKSRLDTESRVFDVNDDDLVRMLVDLIRAITEETFLVIVFDDLHHADVLSLRILGRAYACLNRERFCLLIASIPQVEVAGMAGVLTTVVERLSLEASRDLATRLLGATGRTHTEEQIEAAAVGSGGNPFVLKEMVRSSVYDPDVLSAASVKQTLRHRVATLSDASKDLLFTCIALGKL